MKELVTSKFYINLYKFSSNLLNELIIKKQKFIVCSNSYSLLAGLSFDLLRQKISNYCVIDKSMILLPEIKKFNFIFLLIKDKDLQDIAIDYDYFFEYAGNENNVLCIE